MSRLFCSLVTIVLAWGSLRLDMPVLLDLGDDSAVSILDEGGRADHPPVFAVSSVPPVLPGAPSSFVRLPLEARVRLSSALPPEPRSLSPPRR
ncbi:MAG: hypothetical protein HY921_11370 [Elusimicrobia bacterium]|nr:hypothetical protein [Elusimicrobiota bacterium]